MIRKNRLSLEKSILLWSFVVIILMVWGNNMPINLFYPISILCLIGTLIGLFLPTIFTTWLIIISLILGSFEVVLGYVLIPIWERILIVSVFPIILTISSLIKKRAEYSVNVDLDEKSILNYTNKYDLITNLLDKKEAKNSYDKYINFLKKTKMLSAEFGVTLIYWAHNEQYFQVDPDEGDNILRKISQKLKEIRMPSEQLFYLEKGYFLIISPVNSKIVLNKLNHYTEEEIKKISFHNDKYDSLIQIQISNLIVTNDNIDKYNSFNIMIKKLVREHEMKIIREYQ